MPQEVIVVDNNCTDATIAIARRYKFVQIVKETKQGRGYATAKGLNAAKGDVLGRIDADSVLSSDWVEKLTLDFTDPKLTAVTGIARANLLPRIRSIHSTLWPRVYYWNVHAFFRAMTTWGANMAMRRTAWNEIKTEVALDDSKVHDDEDISLLILSKGGKIVQDNKLIITNHKQSYGYLPKFISYMMLAQRTRAYHQEKGTFDALKMRRLSLWLTLPGYLVSIILGIPYLLIITLVFPLDLIVLRSGKDPRIWLD